MDILRTPDERFAGLPGYDFAPHYLDDLPGFAGLRMHYLDEGPADAAETFLCLHGQPTWSYLYRRMIPIFAASGARVVAPDMFGFGRSDKPADDGTYTYHFHRNSLMRFIERLDLRHVTLVCQDWGGLYGLTIVPDMAERFSRLIVMNTTIPAGESPGPGFDAWKAFNRSQPDLAIGRMIGRGTPHLTPAEIAAYDAPYPDARYKGGVRRFPELVPVSPEMDGVAEGLRARAFWSKDWRGKSFMAIGMADPVLGPPAMKVLHDLIRGCPAPLEIPGGGHFVQEWGEEIAQKALQSFA